MSNLSGSVVLAVTVTRPPPALVAATPRKIPPVEAEPEDGEGRRHARRHLDFPR